MSSQGGFSPLHLICGAGVVNSTDEEDEIALEIVRILIDASHESVLQTTEDDQLAIHFAASERSSEICNFLLNAYPESWKVGIRPDGSLPIHHACGSGRIETVKMLLERYPESLHLRDACGLLPIHHASQRSNQADIIEFLLKKDPNCLSKTVPVDNEHDGGRLPLHFACDSRKNSNTVRLLFQSFNLYPEAIMKPDDSGELPIDIVRNSIESGGRYGTEPLEGKERTEAVNIVAFLQTQMNYARQAEDREAMTAPDSEGMLPLHRAICSGACLGAVKLLLKGNPEAIQSADLKGNLPIHLPSKSSSIDVVEVLADLDLDSLTVCNAAKHSALHCACLTGNNIETVQYLLDRQVASVSERNSAGLLPIHTGKRWNYQDTPLYVETVMRLLLAYPETVGAEFQNRS